MGTSGTSATGHESRLAARGEGAGDKTQDLTGISGARPFVPRPGRATTLVHGLAAPRKVFPGTKELVAREASVEVIDRWGQPLPATLDVHRDVVWVGYAHATRRARIDPVLQRLLREQGAGSQGLEHRSHSGS